MFKDGKDYDIKIIRTHSEETRAKMSAAKKGKPGKPHNDSARAKMSASQKGKIRSKDWCAKMSAVHKGKVTSAETRAKMSAAKKGRTFTDNHRNKINIANQARLKADKEAEISRGRKVHTPLGIFNGASFAAEAHGIDEAKIRYRINQLGNKWADWYFLPE